MIAVYTQERSRWETCQERLSDLFGVRSSSTRSFLHGSFFTLRIEHREGGAMAQHSGEERFLLFRSDEAGVIAKIVFSSIDQVDDNTAARAKILVLEVKSDYRGQDLGGLLFTQAMNALLQRYESVDCQLDVEENMQRHDRLLLFYQQLGCEVKPKAKIQYVNNNDGEIYRKVPMTIHLEQNRRTCMLGANANFLPIQLLEAAGHPAGLDLRGRGSNNRRLKWLIIDDATGRIQLQTTGGQYLRMDELGHCSASNEQDDLCFFSLYRASDEGSDSDTSDSEQVRRKDLWMLQSAHGSFLTIDCQSLACSKAPSFWQADDEALSLTYTTDTPLRRHHYRQYWVKQTVAYVEEMRRRYLKFELGTMTLRQALDLLQAIPCHPYSVQSNSPSMRTLCFRTAEAARNAGHPDWVQLMALIHELGSVVNQIDVKTASESEDGHYDWTRASRSRIVGCSAPDRVSFAEFRYLNTDEREYSTPQGIYDLHCGLEHVLLTWTGPEYLFHMLKHNAGALIPDEGLSMLRYFTLGDWHTHNEYAHLTNEDDGDIKLFVADFDTLRRTACQECREEMTGEECDQLWEDHYSLIVAKYGLLAALKW